MSQADLKHYIELIRSRLHQDYAGMFREAGGIFEYPFLAPGSDLYADCLWDWDSWLSNIALRQILAELNDPAISRRAQEYERGCVLNFLNWGGVDGWIPTTVSRGNPAQAQRPPDIYATNMHKPVLAQHAAFLVRQDRGEAEWLRQKFSNLLTFLNNYRNHHRHACGLYFWQNDRGLGVDNDPCTYFRPPRSSGSIYLNCLMYKELEATVYLCERLNLDEVARHYRQDAAHLKAAIAQYCWDERDGFYYSVDLNLVRYEPGTRAHAGYPPDWPCLIQRLGVWSGFLGLWAGLATPEQAERVVKENYLNPHTFNAPYGVRSLSKLEKMYSLRASGNPSGWLGPIWGVANYLTFRGLLAYGYDEAAAVLAGKTIRLFGRDFERFGMLHEYYQPENGEPIMTRGFQSWNWLVLNMCAWLEQQPVVTEF